MNSVNFLATAIQDPETKYLNQGSQVTKLRVSISAGKKQNGDWKPSAFLDVECWDKVSEAVTDRVTKGAKVLVSGYFAGDEWADRETGKKRNKTFIRATRIQVVSLSASGPPQGATPDRYRDEDEDVPF